MKWSAIQKDKKKDRKIEEEIEEKIERKIDRMINEKIVRMINRKFVLITVLVFSFLMGSFTAYADLDQVTMKKTIFGHLQEENTPDQVMWAFNGTHNKSFDLSEWGLDGSLEYVHGMYYLARVNANISAKSADSIKGRVKVKKGEQVIIIFMKSRYGNSYCRLKNGRTVVIPSKKMTVLKYLYNSSQRYSDAQIEEWVKANKIESKTRYIFLVSKFNQYGWILERTPAEWNCKYYLKITTGVHTGGGLPNDVYPLNALAINTHYINKKGMGRGISYASKQGGNQIHTRGTLGYPSTHGCIAMSPKDYNFVYNYLPYNTRVVLF